MPLWACAAHLHSKISHLCCWKTQVSSCGDCKDLLYKKGFCRKMLHNVWLLLPGSVCLACFSVLPLHWSSFHSSVFAQNQVCALLEKEECLRARENAILRKEKLADSILQKLDHKEASLREHEALLLEVEEYVAVCYTAIEECIQEEIHHGVEVWLMWVLWVVIVYNLQSRKLLIKKENMRLKEGLKSVCSINEKLKTQVNNRAF